MVRRASRWIAVVLLAAASLHLRAQQAGGPPATSSDPAPPHADLGAARELVKTGKYDDAEQLLSKLQETYPDDPSLLLLRGEVLLAAKKPDKAAEVLRHAADVAPRKIRVQFDLGSALSALGDTAGALDAFGKEIDLNEDPKIRAMARVNRSILFDKAEKWIESAAEIEALLESEPDRKEAYGDLAQLYLKAGRPEDAGHAIERGAEHGFQSSGLNFSLGVAYFNQREYDKAVESFRKAIEIQSDLAQAEFNLAKALDQLARRDEARTHLARYLELRPDAPEAAEIKKRLSEPSKDPQKPTGTKVK